jgi:hypothetical protein
MIFVPLWLPNNWDRHRPPGVTRNFSIKPQSVARRSPAGGADVERFKR